MAQLTYEEFKNHLHSEFKIKTTAAEVALQLFKISEHNVSSQQDRFSIFFKGPLNFFLQQDSYSFHHDGMGVFDMFIVPISQEKDGFVYEAVFNRLVERRRKE